MSRVSPTVLFTSEYILTRFSSKTHFNISNSGTVNTIWSHLEMIVRKTIHTKKTKLSWIPREAILKLAS